MRKWNVLAAAIVLAGLGNVARGDVLANWTFETSEPPTATGATNGPWAAEVGVGSATGVHADVNGGWSSPAGNGSPNSWNGNTWTQGDYFQFQVSTIDFEDITLTWDQTRSSTGPGTWDLQYATSASGPFTTFTNDYTVSVITWSSTTPVGTTSFLADLSALASVEGTATLYFRIVADSSPTSTAGASRLDNVTVSGTPIPEPHAVLPVAGAVAFLRRHRRSTLGDT
jgi:hypothetical protein